MILAINLAVLPVGFVAVLAARELRPWWRQLQQIRALPESMHPLRALPASIREEAKG